MMLFNKITLLFMISVVLIKFWLQSFCNIIKSVEPCLSVMTILFCKAFSLIWFCCYFCFGDDGFIILPCWWFTEKRWTRKIHIEWHKLILLTSEIQLIIQSCLLTRLERWGNARGYLFYYWLIITKLSTLNIHNWLARDDR